MLLLALVALAELLVGEVLAGPELMAEDFVRDDLVAHARFHVVWQVTSYCGIALVAPANWGDGFMAAGFGVLQIGFGLWIAKHHGG